MNTNQKRIRASTHPSLATGRAVEQFRVRIVGGPDLDRFAESSGGSLSIGAADDSQLQLSDPAVSRYHCVVRCAPGGLELCDLDSTNGTTLGGHRVQRAFLRHGAVIGVGDSLLLLEVVDEDAQDAAPEVESFGGIVGRTPAMRRLFSVATRVAPSDATVLIQGETGTGKGMLAAAIHKASPRADGPFIVVDCGALPANLIETELFGHMKGAFTGAHSARQGLFEAAAGGTVLLDEIGELPLALQPKLLRVIEKHEVRLVGSDERRPVDVRVIAATHRDLKRDVARGTFRADLWYRLQTFRMEIPPLRARPEDIPLLAAHFYAQFSKDPHAVPPPGLLAAVTRGRWQGNVRELRSAIEHALIFDDYESWRENEIDHAQTVELSGFDPSTSFRLAKERATGVWERAYLQELVQRNDGNLSRAARAARMDRGYLRSLLRRHEIPAGATKL